MAQAWARCWLREHAGLLGKTREGPRWRGDGAGAAVEEDDGGDRKKWGEDGGRLGTHRDVLRKTRNSPEREIGVRVARRGCGRGTEDGGGGDAEDEGSTRWGGVGVWPGGRRVGMIVGAAAQRTRRRDGGQGGRREGVSGAGVGLGKNRTRRHSGFTPWAFVVWRLANELTVPLELSSKILQYSSAILSN